MKSIYSTGSLLFLFVFFWFSTANATFLTMTLTQPKESTLKGWKIYYAIHVDGEEPTPEVSPSSYDGSAEWIAFSAPDVIMPIETRPWGLELNDYPGWEETYWAPRLTLYMPGLDPTENKNIYFVATATGFGSESGPSNIFQYNVYQPGQPSAPEVGYTHSAAASKAQDIQYPLQLSAPSGEVLRIERVTIYSEKTAE